MRLMTNPYKPVHPSLQSYSMLILSVMRLMTNPSKPVHPSLLHSLCNDQTIITGTPISSELLILSVTLDETPNSVVLLLLSAWLAH
jgi:hypothetical protein